MAAKTRFKINGNGSSVLPLTGGVDSFTAEGLDYDYGTSEFYVVVYDGADVQNKATPTTGTITITTSNGDNVGSVGNGSFNATSVNDLNRPTPISKQSVEGATIVFDGVDSGMYARAWVVQRDKS